ncbi:MAG TPA: hypothetical protein VGZ73_05485, partial [Bryobacteraceae bacterium]|nr:hypothetical protein [Bryobacteraceae bacterium]
MRRKLLTRGFEVAALIVVLGATMPAHAGQLFAFDYSIPGTSAGGATPMDVTASGFFSTTDLSGNSYTINGVYGTWNGMAITGILDPGTFGSNPSNDNLLYSSGPLLDLGGLGFTVAGAGDDGSGNVNVYYDASQGGYTEQNAGVGGSPSFSISPFTPSPVYFDFSYSIPGFGDTPMDVAASGMITA